MTILLDAASATTGTLAELLDKFDTNTVGEIWGTRVVNGQKVAGWYSTLIPAATALGALFSLLVAARIAYRSMTLQKGIDVLELLRPILISFVLAFWWPITWSLYSFTQPLEGYFRSLYEYKNKDVVKLKEQRRLLSEGIYVRVEDIATEMEATHALTQPEPEGQEAQEGDALATDGASTNESVKQASRTAGIYFNDILYEDDIKGEVLVNAVGDTIRYDNVVGMASTAWSMNKLENGLLWIAEAFWTMGVFFIFLIRNLFLTVLVLFGPVYIMCSMLPVWKNKWADWVSRFIGVGLYGPLAYIAMYFSLILIEFAVRGDIARMQDTLNDGNTLLSYIAYVGTSSIPTVGYYLIAHLIGTAAIPLSVELASFFIPADLGRGATKFFAGMQQHVNEVERAAEKTAKKAVASVATGGAGAVAETMAEREVAKAAEELAEHTAEHTAGSMAGGAADSVSWGTDAESFADRFWHDKLNEATGQDADIEASADEIDEYIRAVEEGKDAEFLQKLRERIDDNARLLAIVRLGYLPDSLFASDAERDAFLKRHKLEELWGKARRASEEAQAIEEQQADELDATSGGGGSSRTSGGDSRAEQLWEQSRTASQGMAAQASAVLESRRLFGLMHDFDWRKEAERAADRAFADQQLGSHVSQSERIEAAEEDLRAYQRAQQAGFGDEYMRIREQRFNDNRILHELAGGRSINEFFIADRAGRKAFLQRHGLYKAYRRAEKLQRKADKLRPGSRWFRRMYPVFTYNAERINRLIAGYCADIVHARGLAGISGQDSYAEGLRDRYRPLSSGAGAWFRRQTRDEQVQRITQSMNSFMQCIEQDRWEWLRFVPWFRHMMRSAKQSRRFFDRLDEYERRRQSPSEDEVLYLDGLIDALDAAGVGKAPKPKSQREFERGFWGYIKDHPDRFAHIYRIMRAMRMRRW